MAITSNHILISNRTGEWIKQKAPATYGLLLKGSTVACVGKVALTIITLGVPLVLALIYDGALAIKHSITPAPKKPINPKKEKNSEPAPAPEPEPFDKAKDYANKAVAHASSFGKDAYSAISSTGSALYTGGKFFWDLPLPAKVAAVAVGGIFINKTIGIGNSSSVVMSAAEFVWNVFAWPFAKAVGRGAGELVQDVNNNLPSPVEVAEGAWNFGNFLYDNSGTISAAFGFVFTNYLWFKLVQQAAKPPLAASMALGNAAISTARKLDSSINELGDRSTDFLASKIFGSGNDLGKDPEVIAAENEHETYMRDHAGCSGPDHEENIRKGLAKISSLKASSLARRKGTIENIKTAVHSIMNEDNLEALKKALFAFIWIHNNCGMLPEDYDKKQIAGRTKFIINNILYRSQLSYHLSNGETIDGILEKEGYDPYYDIPLSGKIEDVPEIIKAKNNAQRIAKIAMKERNAGTKDRALTAIANELGIQGLFNTPNDIAFKESLKQTLPDFANATSTATASAIAVSALSGSSLLFGGIPSFVLSLGMTRSIYKRPPLIRPGIRAASRIIKMIPDGEIIGMPRVFSNYGKEIAQAILPALSLVGSMYGSGPFSTSTLVGAVGTAMPFVMSKFERPAPVAPPVAPPVAAPVAAPVAPPVAPPVASPSEEEEIRAKTALRRAPLENDSDSDSDPCVEMQLPRRAQKTRTYSRMPPGATSRRMREPRVGGMTFQLGPRRRRPYYPMPNNAHLALEGEFVAPTGERIFELGDTKESDSESLGAIPARDDSGSDT